MKKMFFLIIILPLLILTGCGGDESEITKELPDEVDFSAIELKNTAPKEEKNIFSHEVIIAIEEIYKGDFSSVFELKMRTKLPLTKDSTEGKTLKSSIKKQDNEVVITLVGVKDEIEADEEEAEEAFYPATLYYPLDLEPGESRLELNNGETSDIYSIIITDNLITLKGEDERTFSGAAIPEVSRTNPLLEKYPDFLTNEEAQIKAMQEDGENICYLENASETVQIEAAKNGAGALLIECIAELSETVLLEAIKENANVIQELFNPSQDLQIAAIYSCARDSQCDMDFIFNWIDNPTDEAVELAYSDDLMQIIEEEEASRELTSEGDSDGDGYSNEEDEDDDNDGVSDAIEAALKTDPFKKDTDEDGIEDLQEYMAGTDPLMANDGPTLLYNSPAGGIRGTKITSHGLNFNRDRRFIKVHVGEIELKENDVKFVNEKQIQFYIPKGAVTSNVRIESNGVFSNPQPLIVDDVFNRSLAEFPEVVRVGGIEMLKGELFVRGDKKATYKKMHYLLQGDDLRKYNGSIISYNKELDYYTMRFDLEDVATRRTVIELLEDSDLVSDAMPNVIFGD